MALKRQNGNTALAGCQFTRKMGLIMTTQNAAIAAIHFALVTDDGIEFLRCWNEGNFDAIRREWPDAPGDVFIEADPLHPENVTPSDDGQREKDAQVSALTHALRSMRKYGFIVVQGRSGRAQTQAEQFRRAQSVAANMLGVAVDNADRLLSNLALEIVKVANAAEDLGQFK